ncbi:MAG: GGDEF domain-containing protein [Acholeplasmatales bacterium]|nr:GGDEF domain-containing protein [Acholeplasmatales bacterium]
MFQHPLIPFIFSLIAVIVAIKQCFISHKFLKVKVIYSFLLVFLSAFIIIFYSTIEKDENLLKISQWALLGVDVLCGISIIFSINYSFSKDKLNDMLTESVSLTKYFVLMDKKDRIKDMSIKFLNDLGIDLSQAVGRNFFDVLGKKYRIIAFNQVECKQSDIKRYYQQLIPTLKADSTNTMDLELVDENNEDVAFYFEEKFIISNEKYKGKIILGDKKNEAALIGMENEISKQNKELEIIKNRFVTIIEKTSDGIFFTDLKKGYVWCNDILVKKLFLSGNSIDIQSFVNNIHPNDIASYKEKMKSITDKNPEYSISYRFNTGSSYLYVREEGMRIATGSQVEHCGIMTVVDNYRFEKTDTILDSIQTEPEMLAKLNTLANSNNVFLAVQFRIDSIPEINEKHGRAIGNLMLNEYVEFMKNKFVNDNHIYRIGGLDFVCFITDIRKMEMLKNMLAQGKILHAPARYMNETITTDVYMGLSYSNDTPNAHDVLKNASQALKFSRNPKINTNYFYYRDM